MTNEQFQELKEMAAAYLTDCRWCSGSSIRHGEPCTNCKDSGFPGKIWEEFRTVRAELLQAAEKEITRLRRLLNLE